MGAEQSTEGPLISNAAAIDACRGKLGRGQLIDSLGSDLVRSSNWRKQVEALMMCDDDSLCEPVPHEFEFDMNSRLADARAALKDSRVADARYRLVPLRLTERQFWRAVFWRLENSQMELDADGCLSPACRRPHFRALAAGGPSVRHPLAVRNTDLAWQGSVGSPGDCQRCGSYTPNGTSLHGYEAFGDCVASGLTLTDCAGLQ